MIIQEAKYEQCKECNATKYPAVQKEIRGCDFCKEHITENGISDNIYIIVYILVIVVLINLIR